VRNVGEYYVEHHRARGLAEGSYELISRAPGRSIEGQLLKHENLSPPSEPRAGSRQLFEKLDVFFQQLIHHLADILAFLTGNALEFGLQFRF
jgi:hypothetical protein